MKKVFILIFAVFFLLAACAPQENVLMVRTEKGKEIETLKGKVHFPAKVKLSYYTNDKYKYLTTNRMYIMQKHDGRFGPYYNVFEIKKVKDGYRIPGTKYENYVIPKLKGFDDYYVMPFTLNGQNGTIEVTFESYDQLSDFVYAIQSPGEWDEKTIQKGRNVKNEK